MEVDFAGVGGVAAGGVPALPRGGETARAAGLRGSGGFCGERNDAFLLAAMIGCVLAGGLVGVV